MHELTHPRDAVGHEQSGRRFAVVLQSDDLLVSTVVVAPTSTSARPASFRPEVRVAGRTTRVLVEQLAAVSPTRLGARVGRLTAEEMQHVGDATRRVLALDLPW